MEEMQVCDSRLDICSDTKREASKSSTHGDNQALAQGSAGDAAVPRTMVGRHLQKGVARCSHHHTVGMKDIGLVEMVAACGASAGDAVEMAGVGAPADAGAAHILGCAARMHVVDRGSGDFAAEGSSVAGHDGAEGTAADHSMVGERQMKVARTQVHDVLAGCPVVVRGVAQQPARTADPIGLWLRWTPEKPNLASWPT